MSSEFIKWGVDLSVAGKTGCPRCIRNGNDNARDNLQVYGLDSNGGHKGAKCFACDYTILSTEKMKEKGLEEEEFVEIVGSVFNEEVHSKLKSITTFDPKGYRGLRQDTTQFFGVRHEYSVETGDLVAQYYPTTKKMKCVGYKRRGMPKEFGAPVGETGKDCELFGQFRFAGGGHKLLIVGGEIDQLSAYQMLGDYQKGRGYDPYPVVSATIGESGAWKQVQAQYDWFNLFDKIIICMDNDEAGKEAAEKVAKVLPKGKALIMHMSLKDPNEYLVNGRQKEFVSAFFSARPYTPDGIVGSGGLMDLMKAAAVVPKIPLPPFMHKLSKLMAGGIPLKTITNLGSASGTGKSTIIDECVFHWIYNSPHKVGVVSLESDCAQYGTKMLSRKVGRKIDLIEDPEEKLEFLSTPAVEAAADDLFYHADGSHRWHLVDDRDGGIDSLKDQIMSLIIACDCRVIILDPLQDVLDGLTNEEQAVFMRWLKGMVKSHDVAFILVNHVRKSGNQGKANSAGADLHEEDFQGSSSIFKSAACNLLFTRNKEAESELERNTTVMKMTKCRWTGNTAPIAGKYYYENTTHRIYELEDYLASNPHLIPTDEAA